VSTVITVTAAQVAAAKAMVKRDAERGRATSDAVLAISRAVKTSPPPKEASTNMIHARELDINAVTTVSDLFELIDLPYRITKKATLSIVSRFGKDPASEGRKVLRLEWSGEPE